MLASENFHPSHKHSQYTTHKMAHLANTLDSPENPVPTISQSMASTFVGLQDGLRGGKGGVGRR